MEQLIDKLGQYVDYTLLVMIVVFARWAKGFLTDFIPFIKLSWKVAFLSAIITILYYYTMAKTGVTTVKDWPIYFITYTAATTFYELLFAPVEEWISRLRKKESNA